MRIVLAIISTLAISFRATERQSQSESLKQQSPVNHDRTPAYLQFDHVDEGPLFSKAEPTDRIWFRLVNNRWLAFLIASLIVAPAGFACDFQYDPASVPMYYRDEGWSLPGVKDFDFKATPPNYGEPTLTQIPGAVAQLLPHNKNPYILAFPAQQFVLNGGQYKMRSLQAKAVVVRWMMDGHIFAYSYGLIPVTAHRVLRRWIVESEAACIFTATFIDDKGDGNFRALVPGPLTTDLVPRWAKARQT